MAKSILITGATSGFGEACAHRFAASGDKLILLGRRQDRLDALQNDLGAAVIDICAVDVRDRDVVMSTLDQYRDVDVLVNNAGLALGLEPAWEVNLDDWETMVDTNVKGLMYCTRAILPGMVARNSGHVINIASTAGSWPYPGGNVYGGTKAFVQQFSRNLRADLVGKDVRVTCISPGMAETEFSNVRFKGDDTKASKVYDGARPLTSADIADIIHYVTTIPPHININAIEVMCIDQCWGPLAVHRRK